MSLRNERLCGKVQVHLNKIIKHDENIDLEAIEDDPYILGYAFNIAKCHNDSQISIEERQQELKEKLNLLDYNLKNNIEKVGNDPYIYEKFLHKLGIVQHSTLLAYSNSSFCRKGLSYYKLWDTQNQNWAEENFKQGINNYENGLYEQAISNFNHSLEYDGRLEKSYTAKAKIY